MHPVSSHGGSTRAAWLMTMGYMGPSSRPTKEMATPPPMSEGTSHTTSSRLAEGQRMSNNVGIFDVPDCDDGVEEDSTALSDLNGEGSVR